MGNKKLEYVETYRGCPIYIKRVKTPLYYIRINGKNYIKASVASCKMLADTILPPAK